MLHPQKLWRWHKVQQGPGLRRDNKYTSTISVKKETRNWLNGVLYDLLLLQEGLVVGDRKTPGGLTAPDLIQAYGEEGQNLVKNTRPLHKLG
jgi:hypothetical protein